MKIHVYYRHASMRVLSAKSRPDWFNYGTCFKKFLDSAAGSLKSGNVVFNLVYDGTTEDFETNDVFPYFQEAIGAGYAVQPVVRFISGGDQRKAWRACVEIVKQDIESGKVGENDYVYLLENDYLHSPGWVNKVEELVSNGVRWEYLTLYDHLDKYPNLRASRDSARYLALKSKIYCSGSHHWRTTPSTCATYMLPVKIFLSDYKLLKLGIYDFKLFKILGHLRKRTLVSPMPSLATHSMTEYLAPAVDWEQV